MKVVGYSVIAPLAGVLTHSVYGSGTGTPACALG
jgi:hypothetical protein